MKDKKVASWYGRAIWKNDYCFMVAAGDGTDHYFSTIEEAMEWCEKNPRGKYRKVNKQ